MRADIESIDNQMPRIRIVSMTFAFRGNPNENEFGIVYRQPASWTLQRGVVLDHKKDKTRLTFSACCNTDDSKKMPLMIIGSALNPREFKNMSEQQLGFDYDANKKGWINMTLLCE